MIRIVKNKNKKKGADLWPWLTIDVDGGSSLDDPFFRWGPEDHCWVNTWWQWTHHMVWISENAESEQNNGYNDPMTNDRTENDFTDFTLLLLSGTWTLGVEEIHR